MKKEDLFDVLGDVNNQYIKEAHMKNKRKNSISWVKFGSIAACFVLLVLCIPMITNLSPKVDDNTPTVEDLQNNKEEAVNIQESEDTNTSDTTTPDAPADSNGEYNEEVNRSDLTKDSSDYFGGSYTDANGRFVIILTEDTPANRTAICKELDRSESKTTFVKGTYTLAYLTELQEKITNAMVTKVIPFVVSSGVYEMTNNIVVRVTTNDETEIAKLYALDTIGGAIKVEYSSGIGTKDLLIDVAE